MGKLIDELWEICMDCGGGGYIEPEDRDERNLKQYLRDWGADYDWYGDIVQKVWELVCPEQAKFGIPLAPVDSNPIVLAIERLARERKED